MGVDGAVPRRLIATDGAEIRSLPLGPTEMRVLSLVDGVATVQQIADVAGLDADLVTLLLAKLEHLRLVAIAKPGPAAVPTHETRASGVVASEHVDLDDETIASIEAFAARGDDDHYALLGVARDADKKAIKRAYFELTSRFHPDRFFRKRTGPYKAKIDAIFERITIAQEVLLSADRRAMHDAQLPPPAPAAPAAASAPARPPSAPAAAPRTPAPVAEKPASRPPSATPLDPPTGVHRVSVPTGDRASSPQIFLNEPPTSSRELLAKRLMAGSSGKIRAAAPTDARPATPPTMVPPSMPPPSTNDAMDALKRRYAEKVDGARATAARRHMEAAAKGRQQGDVQAVAAELRQALALLPDDAALKRAYEDAQRAADEASAQQHAKRAQTEESSERWEEAARSWRRVAQARASDHAAHDRAAACFLKAGTEVRDAVSLAKRACELAPDCAKYKATLANAYFTAGLPKNAKREIEHALKIEPEDAGFKALAKKIAKG
jgi:hypothetical protein